MFFFSQLNSCFNMLFLGMFLIDIDGENVENKGYDFILEKYKTSKNSQWTVFLLIILPSPSEIRSKLGKPCIGNRSRLWKLQYLFLEVNSCQCCVKNVYHAWEKDIPNNACLVSLFVLFNTKNGNKLFIQNQN